MEHPSNQLKIKWLGIDTYREAVIYLREDSHVCRSEGFEVHARVTATLGDKSILATLNTIDNGLLLPGEVGLSKYAWELLNAEADQLLELSHPKPLHSLSYVRSKIYGEPLKASEMERIIQDIAQGRYSDIHIATFLTACAGGRLSEQETIDLTHAMLDVGQRLHWDQPMIVDKHCVGGLPGNRTTPIIVPIVTAFGMTMPKTSSRAITSPAGTADTMETLAPVNLNMQQMRQVVEREGGCIVWGGAVDLSPADDILIRVERVIDLDSEGQLIASVLSKKVSAGSTHILIDIPMGPKAKVRSMAMARTLQHQFQVVAKSLGIEVKVQITNGAEPVGYGIGPALEARDILSILQNKSMQPLDLRERALTLAGEILEFSPDVQNGQGKAIATKLLDDGSAWKKFQAICDAQGGMREPPVAKYQHVITAKTNGSIAFINNRQLSRVAKLAGAPHDQASGIELHTPLYTPVLKDQPLYTVHAESQGELNYALSLVEQLPDIIEVEPQE